MDDSLDAGERCPREDHIVGDAVLTIGKMDSSQLYLLETLQAFDISTVQGPHFTSIQKYFSP